MGLRPTQRDENEARRHPRESGGPWLVSNPMDSRFRGNDVIFERAAGDEESRSALKTNQGEIPRSARNDKGRRFSATC